MIIRSLSAAVAISSMLLTGAASAGDWPTRPITLIAPFAPGGSIDGVSRILAQGLSDRLGQAVVVENKPGAGGSLGVQMVARARPDGYTLGTAATGALTINPHIKDSVPLDPLTATTLVSRLVTMPLVLVASKGSNFKTLGQMLSYAKQHAEGVMVGSAGQNTAQHMQIELLKRMTGASLTHVPYKGSSPAVMAALSNEVQVASIDLTSAAPHIKTKDLIALGISPAEGSMLAPDIPPINKSVPGFDVTAYLGLIAPTGLPENIIKKLNDSVEEILAEPTVQKKLLALMVEPAYQDHETFSTNIEKESKQWKSIINSGAREAASQ